ncbi:MAG: hypothetical protein FWC15_02815 [Fibromonadales bacterium]|nr:hypothetical protein [Fibromonadales bacterium]
MPSLRALLLRLFLVGLAIFVIVLFIKKSKPELDAQSFAEQNPECNEIKIHSKKEALMECFFHFESVGDLLGEDTLYMPMARFIGDRFPNELPLRVKHIFSWPNEVTESIRISGKNISVIRKENAIWRNEHTGCKFPGLCPVMPLKGSAIPQQFAKEDRQAERIFRNKFSAIGEAPVNAILPGKILKIEQHPLFSVTIYHGDNIYSKTSGLNFLSDDTYTGKLISPDQPIGFLPPMDTAFIFVEIIRNGKYELWEKFYEESR